MNRNDGKFTRIKKVIALVIALGVLWASIVFSKNGFNFDTNSQYVWIGWLLAFAATSAEFMLASDFRKINWSILMLGVVAYVYSIWTNIQGFQALRGMHTTDLFSISASIFMDVYPEVAISWALGESKLGDVLGNLVKTLQNPEQVTAQNGTTQQINLHRKSSYVPTHKPNFGPQQEES
jgi:hypothetical protein